MEHLAFPDCSDGHARSPKIVNDGRELHALDRPARPSGVDDPERPLRNPSDNRWQHGGNFH
jgi:hypothetical protein